jgi:glycosyltransferase involved in cell wall biosynthesis
LINRQASTSAVNILFIHQNFPGQFKHLAPALVERGHQVTAMPLRAIPPQDWYGVQLRPYQVNRGTSKDIHPWVSDFETKTIRAEACFRAALALKTEGYTPDIIIAHHGWGESLFLKDLWPQARLGLYCEFFYHPEGADVGFDPEFPPKDRGDVCRLRLKNLNNLAHFEIADAGLSPTHYQASTFPERFRQRIQVIHDGIDTDALVPDPSVQLTITTATGTQVTLSRADEVVTFVNRNLEPYRGYHIFMRALPELLKRRSQARVLIVGGEDVSYGARPDPSLHGQKTWKQIFIDEVRPQIPEPDWARVHFLGKLDYAPFIVLLRLSRVHVYLTYPFVLSWSLLEAMSLGCAIVASDTAPVREAIRQGETGQLVDFFDAAALVETIDQLLTDHATRQRLGDNARAFAQINYDLKRICLPGQLAWVEALAN